MAARNRPAVFTEKSFYLEEFYGKSLLFALVPPVGQRMSDFDSHCENLARAAPQPNPMRRDRVAERVAARDAPDGQNGAARKHRRFSIRPSGLRTRPYPPDSAVAQIWHALSAGSIVVGSTSTDDPEDLAVFAQELASRLRVFKLILLDRAAAWWPRTASGCHSSNPNAWRAR